MADTTTTAYGLTKPEIGASEDTWGTKINTDLDTLDTVVNAIGGKTAAATLSYADAAKIATTATGVDVTGTVTATGTSVFASLDISGDIDVDGTTNLDVVDIDGAVNMATTALVTGVLTTTAATVHTGGITMPDNAKAIFGAGSDLQIYHDGSNSYIDDAGTGNLRIRGSQVILEKYTGETILQGIADGSVYIFHDNAEKLATTSTGIDVTGTVTADGLTVDGASPAVATFNSTSNGVRVEFNGASTPASRPWEVGVLNNADGDFQIYQAADAGAGDIKFYTDGALRQNIDAQTGDISFYEDTGTTAKFFWDASAESLGIGTSSPGQKLVVDGNIQLGTSSGAGKLYLTSSSGFSPRLQEDSNSLSIYTNNSERMRIDSSGNVGIGCTPSEPLDVSGNIRALGANSRVLFGPDGFEAGIKYAADASLQIASRTGEPITFTNGNDGTERMRIDASGNVLIGKTATGGNVAGMQIINGSFFSHVRDGGVVQVLNRKSSNGDILSFEKDNTTVGSIAVDPSNIAIGSGDTGIYFNSGDDALIPVGTGGNLLTSRDNAIDLGRTSTRFKDLYLSGGVYLGGTGAANKLDDYEEGTFTPTLSYSTAGNSSFGYSAQVGHYVKVGDIVHFQTNVRLNAFTKGTGSGSILLNNLPYTSHNTGGYAHAQVSISLNSWTFNEHPTASVIDNTNYCHINTISSNAAAATISDPDAASMIWVSGTYRAA